MHRLPLMSTVALALACGREAPKSTPLPSLEMSTLTMVLAPGDGLEPRSLKVTESFLLLEGCAAGTGASLFLGSDTDLAGLETTLLGGNWCGLHINLGDEAELKAITHAGDWLTAPLGGTEIALEWQEGFSVDGQAFILELGSPGWLKDSDLEMNEGENRTLTGDDPETELIRAALREGSVLYEDLDGNGVLGSDERDAVRAQPVEEEPEDTGSPDTGGPDTGTQDTGGD